MKRKASSHEDLPRKKAKINNEADTNLFDLLPDEILQGALSYLSDHDLRRIRLGESRLFTLVNIRHFSMGLVFVSEMSEVTRVFGRYDKPVGLTFRKPHMLSSSVSYLTQLTQLVSLDIGMNTPININQKLTDLESLTASVSFADLQCHTQLTHLVANRVHVVGVPAFPAELQQMSADEISVFNEQVKRAFGGANIGLNPNDYKKFVPVMPNLKHLELKEHQLNFMPGVECQLTGLESLSTEVAINDLPVSTMTGLTVLVKRGVKNVKWNIRHLTNLRQLDINNRQLLSHNSLLPFKLLESFTLRGTTIIDGYLAQLISSQITQLDIMIDDENVIDHVTAFGNLKRLALIAGPIRDEDMQLDLAQLSHMIHLTSLNLLGNWYTLQNIKNISTFTNLQELNIEIIEEGVDSNEVIDLCGLTRLTHLAFKFAMPPVDLSSTTNLMSLEYYASTAPIGLSLLHNLTSLCCPCKHEIFTLTSLQELTFTLSDKVSDEELKSLSNLTRLTSLTASTSGSGECLTSLTRLQNLNVTASTGQMQEIHDNLKAKLIYCKPLKYSIL